MRSRLAASHGLWHKRDQADWPQVAALNFRAPHMLDFETARVAMVDCQVRPSDVTRYNIIEAMLNVPRENFVPGSAREVAYSEADIPVGNGNRVILSPRSMGKMLDAAAIGADDNVLYVGSAHGYGVALISRIAAVVVGVEPDETLAETSRSRLADLEVGNAIIEVGTLVEGASAHAPYDVIFVEGAVEEMPQSLIDQLAEDGRIIAIVVEQGRSQARVGVKSLTSITWRRAFDATAPILDGFNSKKSFDF